MDEVAEIIDGLIRPTAMVGAGAGEGSAESRAGRLDGDQLFAIFQEAPIGIALVDGVGRIVRSNPALREMLGWTATELRSRSVLELSHPEDLPANRAFYREILEGPGKRYRTEGRFLRKDGSILWARLTVLIERDRLGRPRHGIGMVEDITERRTLEAQLQQAQKMEAIGRLASGIAHDFNNLLTAILGHVDVMLAELSPQHPIDADLEEIGRAAERAASLTRQLLALGRQQAHRPMVIEPREVIADMERLLRRSIGDDVELFTVLPPGLGRIRVDRGQFEQVLLNLAVNGRDAMPLGGRLTIEAENVDLPSTDRRCPDGIAGAFVALRVRDTGIGMSPEVLERIFEPFYTTKEPGKGTGLGLPTAYRIVEENGGYIAVESEPGRGTVFTIYFPRVQAEAEPCRDVPAPGMPGRGSETVLVVEDDESVRKLIRRILRLHHYPVLEARCGAEALEIVERHAGPIRLLLTDVVMPEMSGPELACRLTKRCEGIRVLLMSGYSEDEVGCGLAASHGFLAKPFRPAELTRKIREVLDASAIVS